MKVNIKLYDDRTMLCSNEIIGKTYENEATILHFDLTKEMADKDFYLEFEKPDGLKFSSPKLKVQTPAETEEVVTYYVEYAIPNSLLDIKGTLKCEVVLRKNGKVFKTYTKKFNILNSINASEEVAAEYPDFISDAQKVIDEFKEEIVKADVIVSDGGGNKYLSDDGTYKELSKDYKGLDNKPKINDVELSDNKTLDELGIQKKGNYALKDDIPIKVSELENDKNYLSKEADPTVPSFIKKITEEEIKKWNTDEIPVLTGTTDTPIILRDLEEGVYLFDGKTIPYTSGSSTTYSHSLGIVQKTTSYTYVQVFYAQSNNVQFFKINNKSDVFEKETTSFSKMEEKTTIAKNTNSTTVTTQLSNNLFYQCKNELAALTLLFPSTIEDDYKSIITFKTGETAPKFTCQYDVIWNGDDVSNNIFVPKTSKYYYLEFYKDVDGVHGYVRPNYIGEIPETVISNGSDFGEVASWGDNNPNNEDRLYRFVSISDEVGQEVELATSTSQIAGVTNLKENVGFLSNYNFGDENDSTKCIVSILGVAPVKTTDNSIEVNDRVMSDDNGYAIKSTNNCGYRVLEILENGLLNIAVSPNTDMIQRIKTDVESLKNDKADKKTLEDYVKNTDYATSIKSGVIKGTGAFSFVVDAEGQPKLNILDYDTYNKYSLNNFISKGTLENVITGKNLETANNKVTSVGTSSTDIEYPSAKCVYKIKEDVDNLKSDILETGEVSDSYIHVEDSIKNELLKLEVDGVCEQKTTTGKNLLPNINTNQTINGITYTRNNDGSITANGTATRNSSYPLTNTGETIITSEVFSLNAGTYYLSDLVGDYKNYFTQLRVSNDTDGNRYINTGKDNVFTISENSTARAVIYIRSGVIVSNITFYPMIEKGSSATHYEPYTGGQPSPSPDYPQDIKTITDSLIVTSCGKNSVGKMVLGEISPETGLFRKASSAICNEQYILYDNLKQYYIKVNNAPMFANIRWYNQSLEYIGYGSTQNDGMINKNVFTDLTLHIPNDIIPKYFKIRNPNPALLNSTWCISTDQNYFGEYVESLITANLPEGEFIGKIDDTYKDILSVDLQDDGKYHLVLNKRIGKVVLDGSELWIYDTNHKYYRVSNYTFDKIPLQKTAANEKSYKQLSNLFIVVTNWYIFADSHINIQGEFFIIQNTGYKLCFRNLNYTNVDDFKNWLSTHNTEVYYPLETPYKVDLGAVDMLLSYDEITNIFTDSDLLPKINAKYYKNFISTIRDLQINNNTLKNELASIENRLTALENASASSSASSRSSEVSNEPIEESEATSDIQKQ